MPQIKETYVNCKGRFPSSLVSGMPALIVRIQVAWEGSSQRPQPTVAPAEPTSGPASQLVFQCWSMRWQVLLEERNLASNPHTS